MKSTLLKIYFYLLIFSARKRPYNKFIRQNSLKSSQGFTFVFANTIQRIIQNEPWKYVLQIVFICVVQIIPAAIKI